MHAVLRAAFPPQPEPDELDAWLALPCVHGMGADNSTAICRLEMGDDAGSGLGLGVTPAN